MVSLVVGVAFGVWMMGLGQPCGRMLLLREESRFEGLLDFRRDLLKK